MQHVTRIIKLMSLTMLASLSFINQCHAHHSAVGYDTDVRIKMSGIVSKSSFRNPHGKILVSDGVAEGYENGDWKVETAAANLLRRRDWDFKSVEPGMKLVFVGHPSKDGKNELYLREIHFEDGRVFGDPDGLDKALD